MNRESRIGKGQQGGCRFVLYPRTETRSPVRCKPECQGGMLKLRERTGAKLKILRLLREEGFMPNYKKVMRIKHILLVTTALLIFSTVSCERIDKAFEAYDKAKNLKLEFKKRADEVTKGIEGEVEAIGEKVRKNVDDGLATKNDKVSGRNDRSPNEEKGAQ
jgi:hypothetical protein